MSVDAFAVALSTVFDAGRADRLDATLALVVDGDPLVAEVHDGALTHPARSRRAARRADRVLGRGACARCSGAGVPSTEAEADGSVVRRRPAVGRPAVPQAVPTAGSGPNVELSTPPIVTPVTDSSTERKCP